MASITVTVNRRGTSTNIYLTDSEGHGVGEQKDNITTEVSSGDTVQWLAGTGISSIQNVYAKANNPDLFTTDPSSSNSWTGTVGSMAAGTTESYNIDYKVDGDNTTYTDDPVLKMKV